MTHDRLCCCVAVAWTGAALSSQESRVVDRSFALRRRAIVFMLSSRIVHDTNRFAMNVNHVWYIFQLERAALYAW